MEKRKCVKLLLVLVLVELVLMPSGAIARKKRQPHTNNMFSRTYYHDFVVKSTPSSALCEKKNILTVNDQFPGPTLHAHKWDTLVINVQNQAQHNVTIHWHGVRQLRDPWSDGAAHITQCPVPPGQNFTYAVRFTNEEGTLWWHAHDHAMRSTVHGAIIVFPRHGRTYPFPKPHEEVPIILGEWWKKDVLDIYKEAEETGEEPMHSDAYTINGQPGYLYPCSKPEDTFKVSVEQGKTYLLRVINAAMEEQLFFAIAGHRLTLVGTDGSYTQPLTSDYIMISPGQTMDLLVLADQSPANYAMAASPFDNGMGSMEHMSHMGPMSMGSMGPMPTYNTTTAFFQYNSSMSMDSMEPMPMFPSLPSYNDSHSANNFTSHVRGLRVRGHDKRVLRHVDEHMFIVLSMNMMDSMHTMDMTMDMKESASMNNISFVEPEIDVLKAYYYGIHGIYEEDFPSEPMRKFDYTGTGSTEEMWAPESGTKVKVLEFGMNVEIVFQGTNVMAKESHPMHLHGHSFYVVGWGFGNFDPEKDPLRYNLVDPPKQSTFAVPKGGWATIRFRADNPGVWLLHCHFEHHHYKGMSMVFIVKDGPHLRSRLLQPPEDLPSC